MTNHKVITANSVNIPVGDETVNLIVTSPPYPMIPMWDKLFCSFDASIGDDLKTNGNSAYCKMHKVLDKVWEDCNRVLKPGGIVCINIGDATRTVDKEFALYANHSRILRCFEDMGFTVLPPIMWEKVTNAPNKFMGSGMLPPNAYVTQEHEYILILRKGGARRFTETERETRYESAYFFEERNVWFSDCWCIPGVKQSSKGKLPRECSAAYPFEVPYRLVNMFSIKGDTVLDPFAGTGTTTIACMTSERNSIAIDIEPDFVDIIKQRSIDEKDFMNRHIYTRIKQHCDIVIAKLMQGKQIINERNGLAVTTKQEVKANIKPIRSITWNGDTASVDYGVLGEVGTEVIEGNVNTNEN